MSLFVVKIISVECYSSEKGVLRAVLNIKLINNFNTNFKFILIFLKKQPFNRRHFLKAMQKGLNFSTENRDSVLKISSDV